MALIEEFEKTGNWLFKGRSFFPLLLYVFMAAIIGFQLDPFFQTFDPVSAVACIAISLFGQLIRALTIGYTPRGTSGRNTKDGQIAEVLNTKGMYSLVRHPLYLGNYFMWLGIMVYVGNVWFVVCAASFTGCTTSESCLPRRPSRGKFGQAYLDWSVGVPCFGRAAVTARTSSSPRNVLKREYNGFFAIFVSLAVISAANTQCAAPTPGWTSSSPLAIHAARYVHRVLHTPQPQTACACCTWRGGEESSSF